MVDKFQKFKTGIDLDLNRLTGLGTPQGENDAINLGYLNEVLAQSSFTDEVIAIQKDAALVPTKTTDPRSRYIITDKNNLHADFGVIAGIGNGDVVEWDGTKFAISFDASEFTLDYTMAYVSDVDKFYQYTKSDNQWTPASGLNELTIGFGLLKENDELTIDASIVVQKKEWTIGNGVDTDYVITHNLNNTNPSVTVKEIATNKVVAIDVENTSLNTTTIRSNSPLGVDELKVTIEG